MTTERGMFIVFEGPDGSGKTTAIGAIAKWFDELGVDYEMLREPGGTGIGDEIREILLHASEDEGVMAHRTEAFLFQASRAQNVQQNLRPALEDGKLVICDRFRDSSVAYQGHGRGLGCGRIDAFNNFSTGGLVPDLTIYLYVDAETGLNRRREEGVEWNRLDAEDRAFHEKVVAAYEVMYEHDYDCRWVRIDATMEISEVIAAIKDVVLPYIVERNYLEGSITRPE